MDRVIGTTVIAARARRNAPAAYVGGSARATNCPFLQVPLAVSGVNSLPDAASHLWTASWRAQPAAPVLRVGRDARPRAVAHDDRDGRHVATALVAARRQREQYSLARLGIASGGTALLLSVAKSTGKNQRAIAIALILTTLHSWWVAAMRGARIVYLVVCSSAAAFGAIRVGAAAAAALAPTNASP